MISKLLDFFKILCKSVKLTIYSTSLFLIFSAPVFANLIDQHIKLVNKFINDMNADPIVADCAAHGSFIASTSKAFSYVYFPSNSFKHGKFTVTPWNDSFDQEKQRVKVDSIITVNGFGVTKDNRHSTALKFRCGYVGMQILAFNWNDPVSPLKADVRHTKHSSSIKNSIANEAGKSKKKLKKIFQRKNGI